MQRITLSSSFPHENHTQSFLEDILKHLSQNPKSIPFKYLYDEKGAELFEEITTTPGYYLTQSETEIIQHYSKDISAFFEDECFFVELGSGSSKKTRFLLDVLRQTKKKLTFIPIDISKDFLFEAAHKTGEHYQQALPIIAVAGDFKEGLEWVFTERKKEQIIIYFPGSTIGNFSSEEVTCFLRWIKQQLNPKDYFLLSTDLIKDENTLHAAYNDAGGTTQRFILNVLHRINHELQASFQIEKFEYKTTYNNHKHRMEIYLKSRLKQALSLQGKTFTFEADEEIHIENSHKYNEKTLRNLAKITDLSLVKMWKDKKNYFSVNLFKSKS